MKMRALLAQMSVERRETAAWRAASHLWTYIQAIQPSLIAAYAPLPHELSLLPLIHRLWQAQQGVALPVMQQENERDSLLTFGAWDPETPLIAPRAQFPIYQPQVPSLVTPTLLLVPMLAGDRFGHRLGYGKGMYDRTLAHLRAHPAHALPVDSMRAIGVAYHCQILPVLPTEPHDYKLDEIITEEGLLSISPAEAVAATPSLL